MRIESDAALSKNSSDYYCEVDARFDVLKHHVADNDFANLGFAQSIRGLGAVNISFSPMCCITLNSRFVIFHNQSRAFVLVSESVCDRFMRRFA